MAKSLFLWISVLFFARASFAYGPPGHQIVGEIADQLLTKKPAGAQVSALIDGITLQKAAVTPDEIKGWDKKGIDDPKSFHYRDHPKIDNQLRDFWRANQPTHDDKSPMPSHHWFHYTDVPLVRPEKYSEGKVGRNQWDIVHMIPYCVDVLQGRVPESNERKSPSRSQLFSSPIISATFINRYTSAPNISTIKAAWSIRTNKNTSRTRAAIPSRCN